MAGYMERVNKPDVRCWSHRQGCVIAGYMERFNKSLAREAVSAYVGVAEKHGLTATELAIAWVKSRPFVASTIIGATSMEQLKVRTGFCKQSIIRLLRAA